MTELASVNLPAPTSRPPPGEMGLRGRHCVPSSRRCNLPSSPRNTIAPPSRLMRPVLITFILSFLRLGRGAESFHPLLPSAPSRPLPPASIFNWGVPPPRPTDPAESVDGWGEDRREQEGGPGRCPSSPRSTPGCGDRLRCSAAQGDSLSTQCTANRQDNNNNKRHIWLK